MPNRKFWGIKAQAQGGENIGHLYLYGDIASETWWGDEVTPQLLIEDIRALGDVSRMIVHIFSGGGDAFAGSAIYSILKQQSVPVTVYVEGIAASAASLVAMGGSEVMMSHGSMMLLHNPMYVLIGYYNAIDMQHMINDLEHLKTPFVDAYMAKTGKTEQEITAMLDADEGNGTWFTAAEAIEYGLADGYIPEEDEQPLEAVAQLAPNIYEWQGHKADLTAYANPPQIKARRKDNLSKPNNNQTASASTRLTEPAAVATATQSEQQPAATQPQVAMPETVLTYEDGIKAERERITALDSIAAAVPACAQEVIAKGKAEGWSFEETSKQVFAAMAEQSKAQAKQGEDFLAAQTADAKASNAAKVGSAPGATDPDQTANAAQMILAGMKIGGR